MTMSDILVSSWKQEGTSGDDVPMDQVTMNFSKIRVDYIEQSAGRGLRGDHERRLGRQGQRQALSELRRQQEAALHQPADDRRPGGLKLQAVGADRRSQLGQQAGHGPRPVAPGQHAGA